jgi:hypothetical protein
MAHELVYGTVPDRPRKAIHVVRVLKGRLDFPEIEAIAEKMRQRALSKYGDQAADVVVVQGSGKNALRLHGDAHCVTRVRAAMFNAALNWTPIQLD